MPRAVPLLLAALTLAAALVIARSVPLIDPDEGRNAEVAAEMSRSGDWVVPALAGMPYLDKPPALFWAAALAIRGFGRTAWAVRLPAALAAAATMALLCGLARRREDDAFALRCGLLLLAAPLFLMLSAYVIFDMPLTLCVTLVWTGLVDELESGATARGRLLMFAGVGAGLLVKGPVMLAWAAGGSAAAALISRSRAPLRWLAWWPGWVLALAVAGGWFALACRRHPEYPHYAFLEESLERLSAGSFHRDQPPWFVPAVLLGGGLPWSLATPWSRRLGAASRVALGFVAFAAVFFTLSHSKLVTYLLPAFPPLAWIAGEAWTRAGAAARATTLLAILYALLGVACGVAAAYLNASRAPVAPAGVALGLAIGLALTALATGIVARRAPRAGFAMNLAFTPLLLVIGHPVIAGYAAANSGAPLAAAITQTLPPGAPIRYEGCYSPGTEFLLGRHSQLVSDAGHETTSNYQARYRRMLLARGQWTPVAATAAGPAQGVVRPARDPRPAPAGGVQFHADRRFVAYRGAFAGAAAEP